MRRYFTAALIAVSLLADFRRCVQVYVTNNGEVQKSVSIEVDGREFKTDERGIAYVDVLPGRYTARVHKDSCESSEQELFIKEGDMFAELKVYCPR